MDTHHLDIVRLAWSRELGLRDDAMTDPDHVATRVDDDAGTLRFVQIGSVSALVGPGWVVERANEYPPDALMEPATLLALTQDHAGRCSGPFVLAFTTEYQDTESALRPLVARDLDHVRRLESMCPPDDVAEARVSELGHWFTVLDEAQHTLCTAGYVEFQGLLADVGVLTAPALRRRGLGTLAAGIATDDALDSGLVAQWCSHRNNLASRGLATRTGYRELGTSISLSILRSTL
ncbi:GNAT family N-acetyltransferase [Rhodococcus sp. NPDC049939]|uniref:GNAT family N-acetyltransferase n=1 Tax=Rhodococcus sp. NPDC049939 TaxID=3155511 RepID=UPI0033FF1AD6